ncbi:winged helix-turn-helix domain-containing protein [Cytobacillus sp. FJAT-54145]|uniref:Winged helix-turn-helix domain-containing protein n=1 Tax=Cytobacillus spartinae TaxID=3299023 RepID=A0ABW6KE32_9BACI
MNEEVYEINSYDQVKALAHKLRRRIFQTLGDGSPRTSQQLAQELDEPRNKVHYHIQELVKVGLLVLVDTKLKGNFEEKYYLPVSNKFIYRLDKEMDPSHFNTSYNIDKELLEEQQEQYLRALKEYYSSKDKEHLKPFLFRLKKDLTKEQKDILKSELEAFLTKWYQLEENDSDTDTVSWEIAINVFPNN